MRGIVKARRHWVVPTALAAVLVSALFISPAVGGPKFVTGPKVVKTITKKVQGSSTRFAGSKQPGAGIEDANSLLASVNLGKGPYVVTSTFTLRKDTSGLAVNCRLRIPGVGEDQTDFFGPTGAAPGQIQVPASLSVAGNLKTAATAQLRCADGSAANDSAATGIEITALKLPKLVLGSG